jgi:hypothetical protein
MADTSEAIRGFLGCWSYKPPHMALRKLHHLPPIILLPPLAIFVNETKGFRMSDLTDDFKKVLELYFGSAPSEAVDDLERAVSAFFADPAVVHMALLRGSIGKPSIRSMLHAYGELDRWERMSKPRYVYTFETVQETGKHTGSGVIHADTKKDALEKIQSVVSCCFPMSYGAKVVVNDIGSEPFNIAIIDGQEVTEDKAI